jgi:iron complex outermembrane receptor protein
MGAFVAGLMLLAVVRPAGAQSTDTDLARLPLEQLTETEVTLASRREQRLLQAPQAVYVISEEDIRRSGATSIAEALRMVPGVEVDRIDSNKWAISVRGFNGRFANKLLVLMDGRSVYSPLFSGVFWDVQDVSLEDVERIEVIRGPAASLWGANAVNGVINVVTKPARNTRGVLIDGAVGTEDRVLSGARYGARLGQGLYVRAYEKYVKRDSYVTEARADAGDAWDVLRGGLRLDWDSSDRDSLTFQGDVYGGSGGGRLDMPLPASPYFENGHEAIELSGANALGRWKRQFSSSSQLVVQGYYDHTRREDGTHRETRNTFDLDAQHGFAVGERLGLTYGLDFRSTSDDLSESPMASFDPVRRTDRLWSVFGRGDLAFASDRLHLVLGSRVEHNDYTGSEFQPDLRLLYGPGDRWSVWAAVARAVRSPSRVESDLEPALVLSTPPTNGGMPVLATIQGNPELGAEDVVSYETGGRLMLGRKTFLDATLFHAEYTNLRTVEPPPTFPGSDIQTPLVIPEMFANLGRASTTGVELAAFWEAARCWRLAASGSWLRLRTELDPSSRDTSLAVEAEESPSYEAHLRSYLDLPGDTSLDVALYEVGAHREVPAHLRLDARIAWRPKPALEIAAVVQDALEARHIEFSPGFLTSPVLIQRAAYVKLTLRY